MIYDIYIDIRALIRDIDTRALISGIKVAFCDLNRAELFCGCKGYRHGGICSHVLAINHMLKTIDLKKLLAPLCRAHKKGGFRSGWRPAWQHEDSSSDDETEPAAESDDETVPADDDDLLQYESESYDSDRDDLLML